VCFVCFVPFVANNLTLNEHARSVAIFMGYDISPDMVCPPLVNMYQHGFNQGASAACAPGKVFESV